MLELSKMAGWVLGLLRLRAGPGVPESVYDDVVPSGVHPTIHDAF